MDTDATPALNGRPGGSTGVTEQIRREAETFARRNPRSRPKWTQYRTEDQERIIADAALTRRNLAKQAKRLGFKSVDQMLDAWLPKAWEVLDHMAEDTPAMVRIATALEQIALELAARNSLPTTQTILPATPIDMSWKCPVHKVAKLMPAGVARGSGRAYPAFLKCAVQLPDGSWCNEKPPRTTNGSVPVVPAEPGALAPSETVMAELLP